MTTEQAAVRTDIAVLDADAYMAAIPALAELLIDAVEGGAAVNFLAGVTEQDARAWWSARIDEVADGTITPFVAMRDGRIVGSTLLIRSRNQNSPHRAEIGKVLVHRSARRAGLGRALMAAAEERARSDGRWLLILDTRSGSDAEAFYRSLAWRELGTMPDHSMSTDGVFAPTTFFWKDLREDDR